MTDELRSQAARLMGQATSARKKRAVRANGKLGGRPKGSKDTKPRKRRSQDDSGPRYEPIDET
jgi:hypothetical protein